MEQQLMYKKQFGNRNGFSLIEMLLVIAISVLLASMSFPAYLSISKAGDLSNSANLMIDDLNLARQTAVSLNRQAELRIYRLSTVSNASDSEYRAVRVFIYDQGGTSATPYGLIRYLPGNVIISNNASWSSILQLSGSSATNESFNGSDSTGTYEAFRFRPDGSTDLPALASSSTSYTLTLVPNTSVNQTGSLPSNFFCLQINPATGIINTYRP
jgi:uncharacterized protein (TIGR02596 family)